jgi:hypothetical protein
MLQLIGAMYWFDIAPFGMRWSSIRRLLFVIGYEGRCSSKICRSTLPELINSAGELARSPTSWLLKPVLGFGPVPGEDRFVIRQLHNLELEPDKGFLVFAIEKWYVHTEKPQETICCILDPCRFSRRCPYQESSVSPYPLRAYSQSIAADKIALGISSPSSRGINQELSKLT